MGKIAKQWSRCGVLVVSLLCAACATRTGTLDTDGVSAVGLTPREWAALSKAGPSHKVLDSFVGEWDVQLTFWSEPKATGESSVGRSQISWVLGKRFVQEQFEGTIAGDEYRGIGIMGYDNGSRLFRTVWADSLNTALTTSSGRFYPDTKMLVLESEVYDPLVSGMKKIHSKIQIDSSDSYTFSMTDTSPEGKRFTSLEMRYKRRL
jgi:hypothetical protein